MTLLAIDIGGTSIKYGIFSQDGKQLSKLWSKATPLTETDNFIVDSLFEIVTEVKTEYELEGITISTAGVVDSEKGDIVFSGPTVPNYTDTPIKSLVEEKFHIRCEVENDVNCAALGEYWKGEGKDSQSLALITIGTGVGGALIVEGEVWKGYAKSAGEIGYLPLNSNDLLQDKASTTALVKEYEKAVELPNQNGKIIFERALSGEEEAIQAIDSIIDPLTDGLLSIIYLFSPETLVIGGGIAEQKDYLESRIMKSVENKIIGQRFLPKNIKCAKLGNAAGMIGAVYNFNRRQSVM